MTQDQDQPTRRSRIRSRPRAQARSGAAPGSHAAERFTDEQVMQSLRNELDSVGNWILGVLNAPPGWDRMEVDLKPQGGRVWLRVTEYRRGREVPGTVGPITRGSPVLRRIKRLQSLLYRPGRGTWLSTVLTITAEGWPTPQYSFSTQHNFDERPPTLGDEGLYRLEDGLEHLESFPRTQTRVPGWLAQLAQEAGHTIEVLAPEAEQEAAPEGGAVNLRLREALADFVAAPSDASLIEVMRQCTAGELLVDATGSTVVPTEDGTIDSASNIQLQSFVEPDGTRSLAAYTAEADARTMFERSGNVGEQQLVRQKATAVLELVGLENDYDHLILDPGGISCRIPRRQIEWLLSSPRNDVAKNGLLSGNIPQVLSGLVGSKSVLLLGVRPTEDEQDPHGVTPVWTKPEDGQEADTLLLFTSAAEVAALDPTLEIRSASGRDVLRYALTTGASQVCINARPPVVHFSIEDISSLLDSVTDSAGPLF